jgi:enterochelin esterase-like enzyme
MSVAISARNRLVFGLTDPNGDHARVSLDCDDAISGRRGFRRTATGWSLSIPRPEVTRVEYRLLLTAQDGSGQLICDPENPERVATAFGERSVALLPGYSAPDWLSAGPPAGSQEMLHYDDPAIGTLPVTVWSPEGLERSDPAPLLVAHDGPEYADLAALTTYAAAMVSRRSLPPFRIALMRPVERDAWYSANQDYLRAERAAVETVGRSFALLGPRVAMGASLGGLSALLLALDDPAGYRGVVAQSGSFFRADLDQQESGYPYFARIVEAVRAVAAGATADPGLQVAMTCGVLEENHANNVQMAAALSGLGHQVRFFDVPDLHNYTAWRDNLDPALTGVLRSVWGAQG